MKLPGPVGPGNFCRRSWAKVDSDVETVTVDRMRPFGNGLGRLHSRIWVPSPSSAFRVVQGATTPDKTRHRLCSGPPDWLMLSVLQAWRCMTRVTCPFRFGARIDSTLGRRTSVT